LPRPHPTPCSRRFALVGFSTFKKESRTGPAQPGPRLGFSPHAQAATHAPTHSPLPTHTQPDKHAAPLKQAPPPSPEAVPVLPTVTAAPTPAELDGWVDAAAAVGDGDIAVAVRSVLHVVTAAGEDQPPTSIRELGATSEEEDVPVPGGVATPNTVMAAADAQLAGLRAGSAQAEAFEAALTSLLSNAEVRVACTRALAADPTFAGLLRTVGEQVDVPVSSFLPLAAQAAVARTAAAGGGGAHGGAGGAPPGDPLAAFFDALADGLIRLGKEMTGVAGAVGSFAIHAGYRIHRLVTAPFGPTPHYRVGDGGASTAGGRARPRRPSADAPLGSPEFWMDVLTTVACAVVAILVAKRLPRARPGV